MMTIYNTRKVSMSTLFSSVAKSLLTKLRDNRGFADNAGSKEGSDAADIQVNLEKYVPKEEFSSAIKAKEDELASLKDDLDKQKMKLLDKEYIDFLESKEQTKAKAKTAALANMDPNKVDYTTLQAELNALKAEIREAKSVNNQILAERELSSVRAKYPDFKDLESDIAKFYENTKSDVPFEHAYHLVKAYKSENSGEKGKAPEARKPFLSEKPTSTVPASSLGKKDFVSVDEANAATISALREKYPNLGDDL